MSVSATFQQAVQATFKRFFKRFLVIDWNVPRTSCLERRRNNAPARQPCAFLRPIGHVDMLAGGHTCTRVSTFSLIAANACRNCEVGVRSRSARVVGTSPEQWKIDTVPRVHRAHSEHYGPVGGGGTSTTNGTILAPLWAWGKHNDWGVLGFSPSHPQQRILAPLWAWGKHNDWRVLRFSPSHPQQRILAPLWAWGKHNNWGVLGFSPSHLQKES